MQTNDPQLFIVIIVVLVAAAVVFLMLRRRSGVASQGTLAQRVSAFEQVDQGMPQSDVRNLMGDPDAIENGDWVYKLEQYSGFLVEFDSTDRVTRARHWVS